jgi:hypothetical protein
MLVGGTGGFAQGATFHGGTGGSATANAIGLGTGSAALTVTASAVGGIAGAGGSGAIAGTNGSATSTVHATTSGGTALKAKTALRRPTSLSLKIGGDAQFTPLPVVVQPEQVVLFGGINGGSTENQT